MKIVWYPSRLSHEFNGSCIIFKVYILFYFSSFLVGIHSVVFYTLYSFYTYHEGKKECSICNQEFFQPSGVDCEPLITRRFFSVSSSLFDERTEVRVFSAYLLGEVAPTQFQFTECRPRGTSADRETSAS